MATYDPQMPFKVPFYKGPCPVRWVEEPGINGQCDDCGTMSSNFENWKCPKGRPQKPRSKKRGKL